MRLFSKDITQLAREKPKLNETELDEFLGELIERGNQKYKIILFIKENYKIT